MLDSTLVSANADLSNNSETRIISLLPGSQTVSYSNNQSYLSVGFNDVEMWQIPIEISVQRCVVERISFAEPEI